jgi:hypothetical protein
MVSNMAVSGDHNQSGHTQTHTHTHTHTHTLQEHISQQATTNDYNLHTHINTYNTRRHISLLTSACGGGACMCCTNKCYVSCGTQPPGGGGTHKSKPTTHIITSPKHPPMLTHQHHHSTALQPCRMPHQQ